MNLVDQLSTQGIGNALMKNRPIHSKDSFSIDPLPLLKFLISSKFNSKCNKPWQLYNRSAIPLTLWKQKKEFRHSQQIFSSSIHPVIHSYRIQSFSIFLSFPRRITIKKNCKSIFSVEFFFVFRCHTAQCTMASKINIQK